MQEIEDRFQQELKSLDRLNVDGKLRMRLQLEEIEKQLNKERLGWLRSVDSGRSQLDSTSRELEVTKKAGDKSKDGGHDDGKELSEKQEKALEERIQAEKRKRFLIAKYQQEQISLKKQADLAKRERAHLINIFRSSNF
ncbi:uncharacterized protein LOC112342908 [Selaginella moellendorffii]|uniref:uncharacterized protein LOC112342908 n=1 Tax=Selaginella moellendorffii TaxID=88036 RepID=UPI000D1D06D3|nr:uncharacterized protein LOC112342908 [Selaginella moellendorffii]|eukprot:XP_024521293.1 uncharacterized protein LOC112342908 [Selaginella moellendorffii]